MGLVLYTNDGVTFGIGYINFGRLRWEIALSVSKPLGKAYKAIYMTPPFCEEYDECWEKFLAMSEKYDKDLIDFLKHSDTDGYLLSSQCKRLYKLFKDLEVDHDKFPVFLEFLKHAADNRRKVFFY